MYKFYSIQGFVSQWWWSKLTGKYEYLVSLCWGWLWSRQYCEWVKISFLCSTVRGMRKERRGKGELQVTITYCTRGRRPVFELFVKGLHVPEGRTINNVMCIHIRCTALVYANEEGAGWSICATRKSPIKSSGSTTAAFEFSDHKGHSTPLSVFTRNLHTIVRLY